MNGDMAESWDHSEAFGKKHTSQWDPLIQEEESWQKNVKKEKRKENEKKMRRQQS